MNTMWTGSLGEQKRLTPLLVDWSPSKTAAVSVCWFSAGNFLTQENKQYVKSLKDEIDWKVIDQLHAAVAQISGFCFEAKKLCVTVEFVVVGVIATFTKDASGNPELDHSIFVAAFLIPLFFWILDAVGYFYQEKIRSKMEKIQERILQRNGFDRSSDTNPFMGDKRISRSGKSKVFFAIFNHSMWLYWLLIFVSAMVWAMYFLGAIS